MGFICALEEAVRKRQQELTFVILFLFLSSKGQKLLDS